MCSQRRRVVEPIAGKPVDLLNDAVRDRMGLDVGEEALEGGHLPLGQAAASRVVRLASTMTIFGPAWSELKLSDVERFLTEAPPEPLLWEAKGDELRRDQVLKQVCGFANSHDGGYLILGARQQKAQQDQPRRWGLDGFEFRNDDPPAWVSSVVKNGVYPYPYGLDVTAWPTGDGRWLAVVRVPPIDTPPCNVAGAVYERISGQTIPVKEPLRLADLFERGDTARSAAESRAGVAAEAALHEARAHVGRFDATRFQFGLGLGSTASESEVPGRLFSQRFEEITEEALSALEHGPSLAGKPQVHADVSQNARQFVSEGTEPRLGRSWLARATWHGAVGIFWTANVAAYELGSVVDHAVRQAWATGITMLDALAPTGTHYLQLRVAGTDFPPNEPGVVNTVVGRGPLLPEVDDRILAGITRELTRALGQMVYEPGAPVA